MFLLILESLGFFLGYLVGFFGPRIDIKAHAERRKVLTLATTSFSIIALTGGMIAYVHIVKIYTQSTLKDHILGFVFLTLPGLAVGMFMNWLTEKISGTK